jgi:hypothetical protein
VRFERIATSEATPAVGVLAGVGDGHGCDGIPRGARPLRPPVPLGRRMSSKRWSGCEQPEPERGMTR